MTEHGSLESDLRLRDLPHWLSMTLLLTFTLLGSVLFIHAPGTEDVPLWISYMDHLQHEGLVAGYATLDSDIPPGLALLLWLGGSVGIATGLGSFFILKCMLVIAAVVSVQVSYAWLRAPAFSAALLLVIVPSVQLGYLDTFYLPFLLLSLRALQSDKGTAAAMLYVAACMIKWQPVIVAPFFLLHVVRSDWRRGVREMVPAAMLALLIMAPFGLAPVRSLGLALTHPFISGNAINAMWLLTALVEYAGIGGTATADGTVHWLVAEPFAVHLVMELSKASFVLCYYLLLRRYLRTRPSFVRTLLFATAGFLAYFGLNTGVHENHLYIACALALTLGHFVPALRFLAAMAAGLSWANLVAFYGFDGSGPGFSRVYGIDISLPFAVLMLAVCGCYLWIALASPAGPAARPTRIPTGDNPPPVVSV